ncbi:Protein CBG12006 [Caenorhabditis briggsae]|uniref:Tyrosine-protein kinase n=3 Tax=Caenorhabditis briggsae TaxID=6238 RepID=A8XEB8_CAEBR|nr:Protein CBG12006 [Caenorhabditis briggsae]ULU11735.1 hypothetical protein L3Y34_015262 [Caenorhabditis briggsae]CAP31053.1 Protein CBG12006 [Caenorhabditis briggsae]
MSHPNIDSSINKRSSSEGTTEDIQDRRQEMTAVQDRRQEMTAAVSDEKGSDKKEDKCSERKDESVINKSTYIDKDVVNDEELYKSLQAMPFYHGFLPRDDLGVIIRNEGDYLIRVTEITTRKDGNLGIKRDIVLSVCSSDRVGTEGDTKDAKSENPGERKMRNLVIRRYDGAYAIKGGHSFPTIEALLANHHVSNTSETKENRFLKTPIELQKWEYRHSAVKLGDKLGEGAFGEVRKGVLQRKGRKLDAAVKMVKGGELNKLKIREMMNEARLMRNFKHKNVVRFFGVAVVEQPLYILLELVNGGALNTYLQKNKNVSKLELVGMCLGAAQGLQYLHANHCIHRDIAARNCLYSIDKVVKLSDFGLSVIGNQFKLCASQKLPIKWLAPETITTLYFTPKTDVYSFGVMCYEIFSEGEEPWDGVTNTETKKNVVFGRHLIMPDSCPEKFRSFIHEKIFVVDPKRRVVMDDVVRFIEPIINDMHNAAAISTMAEKSERFTKTSDVNRSVMASVTGGSTPRKASESSRDTKNKANKKKKAAGQKAGNKTVSHTIEK